MCLIKLDSDFPRISFAANLHVPEALSDIPNARI